MHRRRMHSERAVHVRLISTIVLQAIFSGGLSKPQDALTFSAFFHIVRLLGGQMGVSLMGYYIAARERVHSNLLGLHVQGGNWLDEASIRQTGTLRQIFRFGCCHGPRCRLDRRPRAVAGVYPQLH